jgi:hypothetical protein
MSSLAAAKRRPPCKRDVARASELEPEVVMTDRNDRIREMAYFLWLEEGCPEGAAERHWLAAETLIESEPLERKRIEGEPPGEPVSDASTVRGGAKAS